MKKYYKEKWENEQREEVSPIMPPEKFHELRPTYTEMIKVALEEMGVEGGLTKEAINELTKNTRPHEITDEHHDRYLNAVLDHLIERKVVVRMPGNRYALAPPGERLHTNDSNEELDQGHGKQVVSLELEVRTHLPRRPRSQRRSRSTETPSLVDDRIATADRDPAWPAQATYNTRSTGRGSDSHTHEYPTRSKAEK